MADREKIKAEIERRRNIVNNSALQMKDVDKRNHYSEMVEEYDDILRFINSLPEEPVSEDLEEAIDTYLATYFGGEKEKQEWPFLKKMAIHFADWQKQQDQSTIELAEDHAMLAGMEKMKEQLLAKAVDGTIRPDDNEIWCNLTSSNLKDGDKVKIIAIKED